MERNDGAASECVIFAIPSFGFDAFGGPIYALA